MRERRLQTLFSVLVLCAALIAVPAHAGEVAKANLDILGLGLEVSRDHITTPVGVPAAVQTMFGGETNERAPAAPGMSALAELTGPGIVTPITLAATPGHRFSLPPLHEKGDYELTNIRLAGANGEFLQQAIPSYASITVDDVLKTEVKVRQLTPEELRERGITVDLRNYDVYEYTVIFGVEDEFVEVPYPVIVDKRTHEIQKLDRENSYRLPELSQKRPPRYNPPSIEEFEFSPGGGGPPGSDPEPPGAAGPRIPAAIILPNGFGVLHQFFAVIVQVSNTSPDTKIRLDNIAATISMPPAMRTSKVVPETSLGQPVQIYDANTKTTFLVAGARGTAEWTLEALKAGTHNIDVTVEADYQQEGQPAFRMRGRASTAIVVNDPRFQITFSHPDNVRVDEPYTAYAFITNLSAQRQHIRLEQDQTIPHCDTGAKVNNICRTEGENIVELDLEPGEMKTVDYKLMSRITGHVFAGAGAANDEALSVAVKLHMGVSQSGIPLSPATLVMPYYARFLPGDFIAANMQLLGLGYSVATAPLTKHTARFPRVIKSDVFQRAQEIARAGQRIFAMRKVLSTDNPEENRDAYFHLALDHLGNIERTDHATIAPDLFEWDELRRREVSGRRAAESMGKQLVKHGLHNGRTHQQFVTDFAQTAAHRNPYLFAYVHGADVSGQVRPYALELTGIDTKNELDVPAIDKGTGFVRTMPYAELMTFDANGEKGELALLGRWSESIRVRVIPQSPSFTLHLIYPDTATGQHLRSDISITGATPGLEVKVDVARGSRTLVVSGGTATPVVESVQPPALRVLGAAQDLFLNKAGHQVSVLFNRPVKVADVLELRDQFALTINVEKASYSVTRRNDPNATKPVLQIPAAALQSDGRFVNVTFDKPLSVNAKYILGIENFRDLVIPTAPLYSANDIVPRIDNNAPGAILTGRVLSGENAPIAGAEVMLSAWGPIQYDFSESDGRFMFEFVPRDIANSINGNYKMEARANGRATMVEGAVRLVGEVHNVNLVFLGRGRANGYVKYSDGEVLKNTKVTIGSTLFGHFREGLTNDDGYYEIGDLPVGPLTFSAVDPDGRPTFAASAIRFAGEVISQDLILEKTPFPGTGTVKITVRRADTNDVVEGARVGVYTQGYGLTEGASDPNGYIEFRKVPAGLISIIAAHFGISRETPGIELEMKADQIVERTIYIGVPPPSNPGYAALEGVVFRDDPTAPGDRTKDVPVPGAVITIGNLPAVTADANGAYTYPDLPTALSGKSNAMLVFDPVTGRKAWYALPTLVGGATARFSPILKSAEPEGEATIRVRLTSATGEPVTDYRVIEPGFPPDVYTHIGGGVYERSGIRVPMKVAVVAVPTNPAGPYGDQMAGGKGRVDFAGQIGIINVRLPGQGNIVTSLKLRQVQSACPTEQPCYTDAFGKVAISYSVWDEIEQSTKAKTVVKEADADHLNRFTKVPALQQTGIYTDRHPAGFDSEVRTLAYEGDTQSVTLIMETIGEVTGRVFSYDRQTPVGGAVVRLENNKVVYGTQVTKPDGSFRFAGIQDGLSFRIVAEYTRDGIFRTGYADGTTAKSSGGAPNLIVVMREQSNIEGQVVDASGNPVPLARYAFSELAWPNTKYGTDQEPLQTDINGKFYLTNIFTGPFRITAADPIVQEQRGHYQGELRFEGDTSQLTIKVVIGNNGLGTIVARVVDSTTGNTPVQNAEVRLYRGGYSFDLGSTDEHGIVRFERLPAGSNYSLSAYSKSAGRAGSSNTFALAKDGEVSVEIVLSFLGRVAGYVTDPETVPANLPSKGDPVQVDSPGVSQRTSTDSDGKFEVKGVPEGPFKLFVYDLESGRMGFGPDNLFISKTVQEHTNLHLELEKTATLTVNAYLPADNGQQGELAPLVDVLVQTTDYYREAQGQSLKFERMITRYGYKITAKELGGEHREITAHGSWPAGVYEKTHNVTFPSTGSVIIRVKDNLGNPVADAKVSVNGATMYTPTSGTLELKNIKFGWVTVYASKGPLGASEGKDLRSRSIPLEFNLNLGQTVDVVGTVIAEEGVDLPSPSTRVVMSISSHLIANGTRRLETFTGPDGKFRFTGIPVGDTQLHVIYYGPDDTTIGWESIPNLVIPNTQTTDYVIAPKKLDATPPRVLKIVPAANENNVSPTANVIITFSEQVAAKHLTTQYLQLRANDSSAVVPVEIIPSVRADNTFEVTLKPVHPEGQKYPLKSNMLYRLSVVQGIQDTTGNAMLSTVGSAFTTVDYSEPAVVRVTPDPKDALSSATFFVKFNKQVDINSLRPEYGGIFKIEKLDKPGGAVQQTMTLGEPYIDPADPTVIVAAITGAAIEESSFYRLTVDKVRDLQVPPNIQKDIKVVEYFSFDETAPVARILSPVAEGEKLVSGVLYRATVEVTDDGTTTEADDVDVVYWLDGDGKYLTERRGKPWAYEFEAPATDVERTYTLQVSARDLSGNPSPSATPFTWTVIPNAPPSNVTLTLNPTSAYPTQTVGSTVTFDDEGVKVTVSIRLVGQKTNGETVTVELGSKQITRAKATDPWPSATFTSTLPLDLEPGTAQIIAKVAEAKFTEATVDFPILDDTVQPEVVSSLPKAETRYKHKDPYTIELKVRDAQTGINASSVAFSIAGTAVPVADITKTVDNATGIHTFRYSTLAGARNADTRVPIVATIADGRGNVTTHTTEVIFERVDDAGIPVAAWVTPLDGAPMPFGALMTTWEATLRIEASDDQAVTKVRFESDRFVSPVTPLTAANAGAGFYQAKVKLKPWTAEDPMRPFVITAFIEDVEPLHTVELPITLEPVVIDKLVQSEGAISSVSVGEYMDKNVVIRGTGFEFPINVPVRMKNLLVLDGAHVNAFEETKLDLTITERFFVDADSKLDVYDRGYLGGNRTGKVATNKNTSETGRTIGGTTTGGATSSSTAGDGSHAGIGGEEDDNDTNATYGSITDPLDFGAGGSSTGTGSPGGNGGGVLHIRGAAAGTAKLIIAGTLRADGGTGEGRSGAGAGGSINLEGQTLVTGPKTRITVNGGSDNANAENSQGGGAGRIAIRVAQRLDIADRKVVLQANGGRNGTNDAANYVDGGAGTIFIHAPGATKGELIVTGYDEDYPTSNGKLRGTPLSGTLDFDAITIGPRAVARFDNAYTATTFTADPTALVLMPEHVPTVTIDSTVPAAGANVTQGTSVKVTFVAGSPAGVTRTKTTLAVQPTPQYNSYPTPPLTTPVATETLLAPSSSPEGPTTLKVLVTDRAGRTVESIVPFTIVANQAPQITVFSVTPPDQLYAGGRIDASITATDDIAVSNITLTSTHGTPLSGSWGGSAVTPRTRTYHWNIPQTLASGTKITLTATAVDQFPASTVKTHELLVRKDEGLPVATIVKPQANQVIQEVANGTFDLEVTASDAEVAVKSVTATFEGQPYTLTFVSGTTWRKMGVPLPDVDGTANVEKSVTFNISDYEGNIRTESVTFFIKPLNDPSAPELSWLCSSQNAMYPAGLTVPLRVTAMPRVDPNTGLVNGTSKVELSINGAPNVAATRIAGTENWTYDYTIPAGTAAGSVITLRATATSTSNTTSQISGSITIVTGVTISTKSFINPGDTDYTANTTVIVANGGELYITGPRTLKNLIVLSGGKVVQQHLDIGRADLLTVERLFVACNAEINVNGLGYAKNTTHPGAGLADDASGGSHIGRGGLWSRRRGGVFGSVYQPMEGGGGGVLVNTTSAGNGGGSVRIDATVSAAIDGSIKAKGTGAIYGTSAGGSVWIRTSSLSGGGSVDVSGGDHGSGSGATGGGGAIAFEYATLSGKLTQNLNAKAGANGRAGGAGSIYLKSATSTYGDLRIDNTGLATTYAATELPSFGRMRAASVTGDSVTLQGQRWLSPSMAGHWVRVYAADGTERGTWRIESVTNPSSAAVFNGFYEVLTQDTFAYSGYVLYSPLGVGGKKVVAVRYANGRWEYDTDATFTPFNPQAGDVILASFTKNTSAITDVSTFDCTNACAPVQGIPVVELAMGELNPNTHANRDASNGNMWWSSIGNPAELYLRSDFLYRGIVLSDGTNAAVKLAGATGLQPGDVLRGVYRFDTMDVKNARVITEDLLEVTATPVLDATSPALTTGNTAIPVVNPAAIAITSGLTGPVLTGTTDAVTDSDKPVIVIAQNDNTVKTSRPPVWDAPIFQVGNRGGASIHRSPSGHVGVYGGHALHPITTSGFVQFMASQSNKLMVASLAPADTTNAYAEAGMNGFKLLATGVYEVWSNGTNANKNGSYSTSTIFRIVRSPSAIRWYVNGVQVHERTGTLPASLLFDVSFEQNDSGELHSIVFDPVNSDNGTYAAAATSTGAFTIPVFGQAGDPIAVSAQDSHVFIDRSAPVVVATMPANLGVQSVTFASPELTGGRTGTGTVTLASPAGADGALVTLASSSALVTLPASVNFLPGATTANFSMNTQPTAADLDVVITATWGGIGTPGTFKLVRDTTPPSVTITLPAAGTQYTEGTSNGIAIEATIVDADTGVASATASIDGVSTTLTKNTAKGPNVYTGTLSVPFIDGNVNVPKDVVVAALDNNTNTGSATVQVIVKPIVDENPPVLTWACFTSGGMFGVGDQVRLKVKATPPPAAPTNTVNNVVFHITDPSGVTTPYTATALANAEYEYLFTIPPVADGASFEVLAVATTAGGATAQLTRSFVAVTDAMKISAAKTITATDTSYENQTVIVAAGTTTIVGPHTFKRLIVYPGAVVTQQNDTVVGLDLQVTDGIYVACTGAIDVTNRGYLGDATHPDAKNGGAYVGGSHIGVGGPHGNSALDGVYGSVYRPREAGAGGYRSTRGGGILRLNTSKLLNDGAIRSNGDGADYEGTAGGSIWILTGSLDGTGTIEARGGENDRSGGGGAIAVEYDTASATALANIDAYGGVRNAAGGAGSVYLKQRNATYGTLRIDNNTRPAMTTELPSLGKGTAQAASSGALLATGRSPRVPAFFAGHYVRITSPSGVVKGTWRIQSVDVSNVTLEPNGTETINVEPGDEWQGVYRFDTVLLRRAVLVSNDPIETTEQTIDAGDLTLSSINTGNLTIKSGAKITHPSNATLEINATGNVTIEANALIDITAKGLPANTTYTGERGNATYTGGSHIGMGGPYSNTRAGSTYGSIYRPIEPGAGGLRDGAGGGVLRIKAASLTMNGTIAANGQGNVYEGGAGGSVWITTGTLDGTGLIETRGGNGDRSGGGGAIAIEYDTATGTVLDRLTAAGGTKDAAGGAGSIYLKSGTATYGSLKIDNGTMTTLRETELPSFGKGKATTGTAGAKLLTDRTENVRPYFVGHWVRIRNASGAIRGTWRVAKIEGRSVTLEPNGNEVIDLQIGDEYQGVYRFDAVVQRQTELRSLDPIEATTQELAGNVRNNLIHGHDITVRAGTVLEHAYDGSLEIVATGQLKIETGGTIDVSVRGYPNNTTYPNLPGMGNYTGGSHMGFGGLHDAPLAATFGSVYMPREAGGGGYRDGRGGGILRITANSIVNDGSIRANGQGGVYEGGAGGSIWITTGIFTGMGVVEANGGGGDRSGGGGAIAVEYATATSNTLDNLRATTANQTNKGGAGTIYLKSATATYGRLIVDAKSIVGQPTNLPSLGTGVAQAGSGGNVLVTSLTNIQPYFVGHWVEVTNGSGTRNGRIASISGNTITLTPEVGPTMDVLPGDRWQGVYRFDSAMFRTTTVSTGDPLRLTTPADVGGTVVDLNDGPPQFPAAKRATILVESTATTDAVVGGEGAVTDANGTIKLKAVNVRTGVTTAVVNAAANGSFRIPVTGTPGDTFTLIATDSHASPLTSDITVNGAIAAQVQPAIELSPESIVAGGTATAVVRLSPVPQKAAEVALTRSNTNVTIPASLTFAAGESAKQVPVVTTAGSSGTVTITATHGTSASATLNIIPSASSTLNSILLSGTTLEGGGSINGTVYLGAPAPAGGAEVMLTSSSDRVLVPASVIVPAGSGEASFSVVTLKVGATTQAFITGTYGETKAAPQITLTPCATMDSVAPPSNTNLGTVWIDDAAPSGAIVNGTGATFDDTRVATGTASLHFTQPATPDLRTYSFVGAATKLTVSASDALVFYMLVNPCAPPQQVVVSWQNDTTAYYASWGESRIDVTVPKSHRGAMPAGGQWLRMEVPFSVLAPNSASAEFHAFSVQAYGGEVWFDRFGATSCTAPTAPAPVFDDNEVVWFDDSLPAGAVADVPTSTRNAWSWSNVQVASGTVSHVEGPQAGLHEHTFLNATQGMLLRAGDVLFTYVYLDPCNPPKQVVLAFNDGSWEHRAYWGENLIQGAGTDGGANRFRMGPLPELGKWVRLEVPVSVQGLDDRTITGAAYALYDGRAWFDRAGKYSRVNVAQGKKIEQNSLYADGYPERANDGRLDTINHNNSGAQGYLDIDLGAVQPIEHVQIWNRSDQTHRLGAHYIMVSDTPFSTKAANISQSDGASKFHWVGGTAGMTSYMVAINRTGRYLRLQMAGNDYLHVREIQAWAPAATKRVNVAGGAVTSSSTPVDNAAQSATGVDGHFNSVHSTSGPSVFRSTSTTQAWWEVDLGRISSIAAIDIFNRINAVPTDLTDFYVFVSDVPFTGTTTAELLAQPNVSAMYHGTSPFTMHSLYVNRTGRYVRIQKRNAGELSFAEVQVWSQLKALGALARPADSQ